MVDFEEYIEFAGKKKFDVNDSYIKEAVEEIYTLFEEDKSKVFYLRQLQVKYEKKYFHWITYHAVNKLLESGNLKNKLVKNINGTTIQFIFHKSNRYFQRNINSIKKIVDEYSQDNITRSCGNRAEILFCNALSLKGFIPLGKEVKEFNSKRWEKTGHDLDYIFSKDGNNYGCEIKNSLSYIDKEELDIKLEMCGYLELKPLFIMRYSPKSYNKLIIDKGGFALIFESQIYDVSQKVLVEKMKNIGLPADCPGSIPDGIIYRFEKWHNIQNDVKNK